MTAYTIINADILDWARDYDGPPFHAILADWPYNLESIQKRFGGPSSKPAKFGTDGAFQRQSRGFMFLAWDTGIAYDPATWELLSRHLLPGAFTASFSHTRTQHRLATAQEVAGYLINPAIYNYHTGQVVGVPAQLGWTYSTGKPNGTSLSAQIDKRARAEKEVIGKGKNFGKMKIYNTFAHEWDISLPSTPLAQTWDGWQYGSPLKPEIEPIIIAQWPYDGSPVDSVTQHGAGAYSIAFGQAGKPRGANGQDGGFPGTLVLSHHPGCRCVGRKTVKSGSGSTLEGQRKNKNVYGNFNRQEFPRYGNDSGLESVPAYDCHPDCLIPQMEAQAGGDRAHYFTQLDWSYEVAERLAMANPVFYSGKVGVVERNAGCDTLPLQTRNRCNPGGIEHDPKRSPTLQENPHPTLKPISLCRHLAGLLAPPAAYAPRRLLVCCSGTGSEMIGALLSGGWDEVTGIEQDAGYCQIAEARLAWWSEQARFGATDPAVILSGNRDVPAEQLGLF